MLIEFAVGFEGRVDGEVFDAQHAHYEDFAESLGEMELEDDALACFLDLAVRCEEEIRMHDNRNIIFFADSNNLRIFALAYASEVSMQEKHC